MTGHRQYVRSGDGIAAFWLEPVSLRSAQGYTPREIERIRRIVVGSRETMLRQWNDFFDQLTDQPPDRGRR